MIKKTNNRGIEEKIHTQLPILPINLPSLSLVFLHFYFCQLRCVEIVVSRAYTIHPSNSTALNISVYLARIRFSLQMKQTRRETGWWFDRIFNTIFKIDDATSRRLKSRRFFFFFFAYVTQLLYSMQKGDHVLKSCINIVLILMFT